MLDRVHRLFDYVRGIVIVLAVGLGVPLLVLHRLRVALVTLPDGFVH